MTKNVRYATLVAVVMTAALVAATGQVTVPVVAADHSGQSVHGLQKSDFEVKCGKAASFDSVEEIAPLTLSNFGDPIPIFVLFDTISIRQPRQKEAEQWLLRYLRKAADEHLPVTVLATTTNGIKVIHDMSTDARVFAAAMDQVSPKGGQASPNSPAEDAFTKAVQEEVSQLQMLTQPFPALQEGDYMKLMSLQLESLRMVGKMLQRVQRRKPLVWVTGSFPALVAKGDLVIPYNYLDRNPSMEYTGQGAERVATLNAGYETAVDSLNDARVSVYPMAIQNPNYFNRAQPIKANNEIAMQAAREANNGSEHTSAFGLPGIAARTGGNVLNGAIGTDFASEMANVRHHFDSYYLLKFTVQPVSKLSWVESSVKTSNPDVKIAVPADGFFARPQ